MMISENNENDGKSHKLDDDCGGVDGGVRSIGIVLISYLLIIIIDCATEPTILFGRDKNGGKTNFASS
ncbi:6638_t:CDS:2 [Rhizophagus irregularis]|nr:6638_t:CDS:2 [Rhizophagus irregularis]